MSSRPLWSSFASAFYGAVGALVQGFFWFRSIRNPYQRSILEERSGGGAWDKIRRTLKQECVWIHAASMGEIAGAAPLAAAIKGLFPALSILVTTTSLTGKTEALKRMPYVSVALLPLDRRSVIKRALGNIKPRLLLIAETEIWPALYLLTAEQNIPIIIFNGRLSDRAFPHYRRFSAIFRGLLQIPQRILVQTPLDAERFKMLGAELSKVTVAGCTKYESRAADMGEGELGALKEELGLTPGTPTIVAGSIRIGEEELILDSFVSVQKRFPAAKLIFAPRHPERFESVARLLELRGVQFERRSRRSGEASAVLLLDTMGELERVYALADVCIVGGGFAPHGGHNPFEPARFSKPILIGPHTANFRDAVSQLQASQAVIVVCSASELSARITQLLERPEEARFLGERAHLVWGENQGATNRILDVVTSVANASSEQRRAVS